MAADQDASGPSPDTPLSAPCDIRRLGPVLILTINDATTRNALHPDTYRDFGAALENARTEPAIRAIILTGAGGTFCAGGNVRRLEANRQGTREEQRLRIEVLHGLVRAIRSAPQPVVAAVEGAASGAGFSLALACDLIVAAEDARFTLAHVRIGLSPDGGATAFLGRALPPQLAAEVVLTGDTFAATRLHGLGLVNRLAPPGRALDEALALADRLAAGPRAAQARAKALLAASRETSLTNQLDREADVFVASLFDDEAAEGLAAFREKRKPNFGY